MSLETHLKALWDLHDDYEKRFMEAKLNHKPYDEKFYVSQLKHLDEMIKDLTIHIARYGS